ncbi:MAG: LysR family transcriptional regulator [Pseudolabrys sp.]
MQNSLVPAALRYVDQVARAGSIQRAAKELNIAASAINRQILKLESDLGVTLFERFSKGMRLTSAGNSVVALARRWKSEERRVASELEQMQGINQGHVRLVAMDSHANGYLPRLIDELAVRHPRISLEVRIESTDEAVAALVEGSADLIAAFNLTPHRGVHILWTRDLPFGCVVAPDHVLAKNKTVSMQEVMAYPHRAAKQAAADPALSGDAPCLALRQGPHHGRDQFAAASQDIGNQRPPRRLHLGTRRRARDHRGLVGILTGARQIGGTAESQRRARRPQATVESR